MARAAIIIPAYNVEKYIHRAIESSISQTESDIEIIIVDDGSTDKTINVINHYAELDSRIVVVSQENSGVSCARNRALDLVTADNVLFLDSDDWLEKNAVKDLVDLKRAFPQKLICSECCYVTQLADSSMDRDYQGDHSPQILLERNEALHYIGKPSRYKLSSSCYKLFDKRVLDANSIRFEESIHYGEDGLFTFQYMCNVDGICYTSLPLWNILDRPDSATKSSYSPKWLGGIAAVDIMLQQENIDKETVDSLLAFKAMRAMVAEMLAIRSEEAPLDDIKYARSILNKNKSYFLKDKESLKTHLQVIALTKFPISVLKILLSR